MSTITIAPPSPTPSPTFSLAAAKKLIFSSNTARPRKRIASSPSPKEDAPNTCPRLDPKPVALPDLDPASEALQKPKQKEKQSKSRNGCITCKAKRFKCDEIHPSCTRCVKRGVPCGGYKKDFKWKPVGESFRAQKQQPGKAKPQTSPDIQQSQFHFNEVQPEQKSFPIPRLETSSGMAQKASSVSSGSSFEGVSILDTTLTNDLPVPVSEDRTLEAHVENAETSPAKRDSWTSSVHVFSSGSLPAITDEQATAPVVDPFLDRNEPDHDADTGCSPTLSQLLLSEPEFHTNYSEHIFGLGELPSIDHDLQTDSSIEQRLDVKEEAQHVDKNHNDIPNTENILELDTDECINRAPENTLDSEYTDVQPFSFDFFDLDFVPSPDPASMVLFTDPCRLMFKEPQFDIGSHEMLMARFDQYTCGIMSVKDGPGENPWRSLVWPLVQENPLLYHAIASMACFHASKTIPQLRILGMQHEKDSLAGLQPFRLQGDGLRSDVGLATAMALAFSESWDEKRVSTGINYIKVAKDLLHRTVQDSRKRPRFGRDLERLKFLCKTYIYLDVISRLTLSSYEDTSNDVESVAALLSGPLEAETEVDPLMGCASSLFPIIGRVANLVRAVYRSKNNSPTVISSAGELKTLLENWVAPGCYNDPEDPTSTVQDSLQTAEAYRWATLLHLHQAVPELPSLPSEELANRSLRYLATVPLTSRAVIVHIYPLLVAGCEATDIETRQWVRDRWQAMAQRMAIGNIDRCSEVVTEVWRRRDAHKVRSDKKGGLSNDAFIISKHGCTISGVDTLEGLPHWADPFPSSRKNSPFEDLLNLPINRRPAPGRATLSNSLTGGLNPEETVRGRLHWISVMMEWNWEVLLG